jgi:transposase
MDLVVHQWNDLQQLFIPIPGKKGRPKQNARSIINGILWVCRTGESWHQMPSRYAPYSTCYRMYMEWIHDGTWNRILKILAKNLKKKADIDILPCFSENGYNPAPCLHEIYVNLEQQTEKRGWEWYTLLLFLSPYIQQPGYVDVPKRKSAAKVSVKGIDGIPGKAEMGFAAAAAAH